MRLSRTRVVRISFRCRSSGQCTDIQAKIPIMNRIVKVICLGLVAVWASVAAAIRTLPTEVKIFEAALEKALQGEAHYQYHVALMYSVGSGVGQSASKAVRWYLEASLQGHTDSQYNLAMMYANGQGVPENRAESFKWLVEAAEQDNVWAQENLGSHYANGTGGLAENDAEAVYWYRRAAEKGHASAQLSLSGMYAKGEGVPESMVTAYVWVSVAKAIGGIYWGSASETLYDLKSSMTSDQIAEAQVRATRCWESDFKDCD